jgi:hypothetical protein
MRDCELGIADCGLRTSRVNSWPFVFSLVFNPQSAIGNHFGDLGSQTAISPSPRLDQA